MPSCFFHFYSLSTSATFFLSPTVNVVQFISLLPPTNCLPLFSPFSQILRMSISTRSSANCALWSADATVTSRPHLRPIRRDRDDRTAQGSPLLTIPTSVKMKEVICSNLFLHIHIKFFYRIFDNFKNFPLSSVSSLK